MSASNTISADLITLYQRAFHEHGVTALWNRHRVENPSQDDVLVVARALRVEGDLAARQLAEQICRASV